MAAATTRALTQSYPVFSLPLAAFITIFRKPGWKILAALLGVYFIVVNLFQIYQYNEVMLHYNDMNRKYYGRIYLNPEPSPADMSLLDTDEFLYNEEKHKVDRIIKRETSVAILLSSGSSQSLFDTSMMLKNGTWVKVDVVMFVEKGLWNSKLVSEIDGRERAFRLDNTLSKERQLNHYCFYERIDSTYNNRNRVQVSVKAGSDFEGTIEHVMLTVFK